MGNCDLHLGEKAVGSLSHSKKAEGTSLNFVLGEREKSSYACPQGGVQSLYTDIYISGRIITFLKLGSNA